MEDQEQTMEQKEVTLGPGGVPQGAKTSDYYRVNNIPHRFNNPDCFEKYSEKSPHPMYRTSSQQHGSRKPTVHDMPKSFYAKSQKFSEHLGSCGMYRNYSLNTAIDSSKV